MTCRHGKNLMNQDCIECIVAAPGGLAALQDGLLPEDPVGSDLVFPDKNTEDLEEGYGYESAPYNGRRLPSEVGLSAVNEEAWRQTFEQAS
jgi:hypothetical protein